MLQPANLTCISSFMASVCPCAAAHSSGVTLPYRNIVCLGLVSSNRKWGTTSCWERSARHDVQEALKLKLSREALHHKNISYCFSMTCMHVVKTQQHCAQRVVRTGSWVCKLLVTDTVAPCHCISAQQLSWSKVLADKRRQQLYSACHISTAAGVVVVTAAGTGCPCGNE